MDGTRDHGHSKSLVPELILKVTRREGVPFVPFL
jgi:hypothetical protein